MPSNTVKNGRWNRFGPRLVRAGGRFKFDGHWYQSDRLITMLGQHIYIHAGDIWSGDAQLQVFMCEYEPYKTTSKRKPRAKQGGHICWAKRQERQP